MSIHFFTKDHEWLSVSGNNAICGITEYAQHALGDVVHIELPEIGRVIKQGDIVAVVESAKAASEVYAPIDGTVTSVNTALLTDPGLINRAAQGDGWFFRVQLDGSADTDGLMNEEAYKLFLQDLSGG